jgi:hypothetical protein
MSTARKKLTEALRHGIKNLRENDEGLQTVEWIFLVVGILVIAGIVVAAVTAFVQGQIAQLPG